jgi:hypothetical protein
LARCDREYMKIASHLEKFRRLDDMLARLDPVEDCELWIWTAMNACTHLLNAALHHSKASVETDSFHTQVSGLYAVRKGAGGELVDALHAPGDIMHVGQPPLAARLPLDVERACVALRILEDLREPHVRGSEPVPPGATQQWRDAYRGCVTGLMDALASADRP